MPVPARIQTRIIADTTLTAVPATLVTPLATTTKGNTLVLALQMRSSISLVPVLAITDTAGNVWERIPGTPSAFGTAQGYHEWWWCRNALAVTSISAACTNGTVQAIGQLWELNSGAEVVKVTQSIGNSQNLATGPTPNEGVACQLAYMGANASSVNGIASATGWTMRAQQGRTGAPVLTGRAADGGPTYSPFSLTTNIAGGVNVLWFATIVYFKQAPTSMMTGP